MSKHLLSIISILFISEISAQSFQSDQRVYDLSSQRALSDLGRMNTSKSTLSDVEGSEYFEIDFKDGTIESPNKDVFLETKMRYNAFYDEIELIVNNSGNRSVKGLIKDRKIISYFGDQKFIYLSYKRSNNKLVKGYLISIHNGSKIELFEKRRKKFLKGRIAKNSLDVSHAPKYVDDIEIYISKLGETPTYLKNTKKAIINYFDKSKLIKDYIKSQNLIFDNYESIIRVVKYYEDNLID